MINAIVSIKTHSFELPARHVYFLLGDPNRRTFTTVLPRNHTYVSLFFGEDVANFCYVTQIVKQIRQ